MPSRLVVRLGTLCAIVGTLGLSGCMTPAFTPPLATTLRWQLANEPDVLDPARVTDVNSNWVIRQLFEGLVRYDENDQLVPELAQRWEVSADGLTYIFHIRRGVKFHNGREVTAHDFAYSFNRALADPKSPVAGLYLNDIVGAAEVLDGEATAARGIQVIDTWTLSITIDAPKAFFLAKLTYPTAFVVAREEIEAGGERWTEARLVDGRPDTHCVGTGPFRLAEWTHSVRVLLQAFDSYWEGRPKIDWVEFQIVPDQDTRLSRYQAGETDTTDLTSVQFAQFQDDPNHARQLHQWTRLSVFYLAMNQAVYEPFADRRVRRAIAYAIDQQRIAEVVLFGVFQPAEGVLPPGVPGYAADYHGIPYDPARARALLAEVGYDRETNPLPPLTIEYGQIATEYRRIAPTLEQMLAANLGMTVKLQQTEWNTFLQRTREGSPQAWLLGWVADYIDPQDFLSIMLHSQSDNNRTGYNSPAFDRLCDAGDVESDPVRREQLYAQANRVAVEDAAWVPIYFGEEVRLVNPRVRRLTSNSMEILPFRHVALVMD